MRRRGRAWLIDINQGKKGRTYHTFHGTKEEAYEMEHALKHELGLKKPNTRDTVNSLVDDFLEHVRLHQAESTYRWKKYYLVTAIIPFFGNYFIDCITEDEIERYKKHRKAQIHHASATKGGNRLINLEILCLKAMAKWKGCEIKAKRLPDKPGLPSILTREEVKSLLDAFEDKEYRAMFLLMYLAGMRRGEVFSLTWDRIDFNNGIIRTTGKGSKDRTIPMMQPVIDALKSLRGDNGDSLVFPSPVTGNKRVDVRKAIERAKTRAEITKRIYPHLLRHSFATHIYNATGDLNALRETMGHTDFRVTKIYTQLSEDHKREVMEKGLMVTKGDKF